MTLIIILWLRRAKRQASSLVADGGVLYTQVIRILLLSAGLEAVPAISYIVCVGLSNTAQMIFLPILGQAQALAQYITSNGANA